MAVFQDVEFVRLRSMEHDTYLHAGEDGRSVLLDARRATHNAAWAVQQRRSAAGAGGGSGTLYILLRGASDAPCCPLSCSCRRAAAQRDFDQPELQAIMWRAVAMGLASPGCWIRGEITHTRM